MIKLLFFFSAFLGAIAASCESSNKNLASSPTPDNSNGKTSTSQETSSYDNTSASQEKPSNAGSQDATVTSSQIKPLGKIEDMVLHFFEDDGDGVCLGYSKSFPGRPLNGPCPQSVEVGNKKVQSKMLVACPEYGNLQTVIYENLTIKENNEKIIKSAKDFFSIKSQDTVKTVCDRYTKRSLNK